MNANNAIFILNPISGVSKKNDIPALIGQYFEGDYEVVLTEYAGHGTLIAAEAVSLGVKNIIAIGGDGTINEIAKSLVGSKSSLGIIPTGSGNGLARHLNIPLKITKAIRFLNAAKSSLIDVGRLNGHLFLCTAGVGLDAEVTHDFASRGTRGLSTYIKSGLSIFKNIKNKKYTFSLDGKETQTDEGIIFTIANASQYGNNAVISPMSLINDGILDLCVLPKMGIINAISHLIKIFRGTLDQSSETSYYSFKKLNVDLIGETKAHVDGEPITVNDSIEVQIEAEALKVLV